MDNGGAAFFFFFIILIIIWGIALGGSFRERRAGLVIMRQPMMENMNEMSGMMYDQEEVDNNYM